MWTVRVRSVACIACEVLASLVVHAVSRTVAVAGTCQNNKCVCFREWAEPAGENMIDCFKLEERACFPPHANTCTPVLGETGPCVVVTGNATKLDDRVHVIIGACASEVCTDGCAGTNKKQCYNVSSTTMTVLRNVYICYTSSTSTP